MPVWQETAEHVAAVERGRSAAPERVLKLIRSYPEIARDVAVVRREAPNSTLARRLEHVYLELHRSLFRPPGHVLQEVVSIFVRDAADVAHSLRWHIVWITALFFACATAGAWLINQYPEVVGLFASESMIERVQSGELWTEGLLTVLPPSLLAISIFANNIIVALTALLLGIFYGLGTAYIIGMNGLMIGAVFSYTAQHGLAGRLFEFVVAHGFVELSVIMIAGACGASLGEALARPGRLTRTQAFQRAAMRAARLMLVCCVFLVGAGLIEGYVSPNPAYPFAARLAIGCGYLGLLVIVLSGALDRLAPVAQAREE